jgi:hypothetical protein
MSVGTVATADTMAGSLMAPPFGFGMQKQYKKLGQYEISSKLLLGRKASGELEITNNKSPKGKTGPGFNEENEENSLAKKRNTIAN